MIKKDVFLLLCLFSTVTEHCLRADSVGLELESFLEDPTSSSGQPVASSPQPTTLATQAQAPVYAPTNSSSNTGKKTSTASWATDTSDQEGKLTTSVDDASGNWFVKKTLVKKARLLYTQIRDIKEKITKQKDSFIEQRTKLNNTLNDFYINFSFDLDSIDTILDKLENQIKELQPKTKEAAAEETAELESLIKKKETLAQLKKSLDTINKLDKSFDQGLEIFFKQEELSRSYEQGAWNNYRSMEELLSDVKAEELYWQIQSALENLQANYTYAYGDFAAYVQKTIQTITESIEKVKTSITDLKTQGIVLAEEIEAQEKAKKEAELAAAAAEVAAKAPRAKKAPEHDASWFSSLHTWFSKTF
jgi:hypothetical protein